MVRTVFTLIAAAVLATSCATVPADQAGPATADNAPENQISAADQREADLRALDELTAILLAASQSYDAAAGNEAAADLVRAGEAPSLYETLGDARNSLAREVQVRVADLDGEARTTASAEGDGFFAIVNISDALQGGAELVLAEALSGESYLVETLRGYLADPAISVETKTFFQEVLPGLRAERDALALLVDALPEGALPEGAMPDEDEIEDDPQAGIQEPDPEDEEAGEAEETDADESAEEAAAAAETTVLAAQS
ncbi:DUF2383 domain-containing protein [Parvularcula flava]|uniref:DUF2383 domain-containing protein n=1 Tax=Aquisalinus luteolus TaxID=1566827 RepID=A0A8J3A1D8_9PROT|nr:DUF2383 domain-containing protein [Aquisalinus luteolus]NHK26615.1 DUF2383 domain-containing protein [Aquisalinus luteolus]GGH92883.1 hypothetical protein GCM10011355_03420 [Aquisalinus luteolus]